MTFVICAVVFWIVCGILSYGIGFAYFQRRFYMLAEQYYWSDMWHELLFALGGPIGLLSGLMVHGCRYGLKFW